MAYTTHQRVVGPFYDVVDATVDALEAARFGVLCEVDVQATFAEKLDEEFESPSGDLRDVPGERLERSQ